MAVQGVIERNLIFFNLMSVLDRKYRQMGWEDEQTPIMNNYSRQIECLFEAVIELETEEQQADFLRRECPDRKMRLEVESLLKSNQRPDSIFADTVGMAVPIDDEGVGSVIDHYKLLEQIGEGGCGVVYVAQQTKPVRRRIALKVIKLGMDTKQVVARFEAERQALAVMEHPNIATVFDAGATRSGRPYFVMELVRGVRITDYCDQAQLSTKERLELFLKVCHAIQHAHQKGIIHRDIKPSNILVTLHDGVSVPKVIDFGIAKAIPELLDKLTEDTIYTQLHQFIGTPAYMSPEQAEMSGLDIDTRSDIYSLGVLLYELMAGKPPFDGKDLVSMGLDAMRKTIREKEPVRPSTRLAALQGKEQTATADRRSVEAAKLAKLLKGDLDWIAMKCLEKDRSRRYDTAIGLAKDIMRHLGNEPVTARPPGTLYKLQKSWRRNKIVFTATAAVAGALLIGAAISTWQAIRATRAVQEQNQLREAAVNALEGETAERKKAENAQQHADAQALKAVNSQKQLKRFLYASDMNLAQQSFIQKNLGRTKWLLDRHRPQLGEDDLRGWEWRHLWQKSRGDALTTLTNRGKMGFSASFSADGNLLAVGWAKGFSDPQVDLWDISKQSLVRTWENLGNHNYQARAVFSTIGNLLAATTASKEISIIDLDTGKDSVIWKAPEQGWWSVRDLSFSQNGSKLAI